MMAVVSKTTTDVTWESDHCLLRVSVVDGGVVPCLQVTSGCDTLVVDVTPEDLFNFADEVLRAWNKRP